MAIHKYVVNGNPAFNNSGVDENGNFVATIPASAVIGCCGKTALDWDATWEFPIDDSAAFDLSGVVFSEKPNLVYVYVDGCAIIERRKGAPAPTSDGTQGLAMIGGGCGCSCEPLTLECNEIDNFAIIAAAGKTATIQIEAYVVNNKCN